MSRFGQAKHHAAPVVHIRQALDITPLIEPPRHALNRRGIHGGHPAELVLRELSLFPQPRHGEELRRRETVICEYGHEGRRRALMRPADQVTDLFVQIEDVDPVVLCPVVLRWHCRFVGLIQLAYPVRFLDKKPASNCG